MPATMSGTWLSHYEFYSTSRREQLASEQEMVATQNGPHIVFETKQGNSAYIFIRVTLEGNTATGTWYETTDPTGYYHGATYHGAVQLIVSKDGKKLKGKWIGFGKNFDVKDGPWELSKLN